MKAAVGTIALLVFSSYVVLLAGCGGSGTSSPVTAPSPVFVSTAPTTASEGETFTYTVSATDPQGGAVTFSLSSAPAGASISGNKITWTPTHAQSRQPNAFTVQATTAKGGSGTQTFSVTPLGDIRGSDIDIFWTDAGHTSVPHDLSAGPVAALVPDGKGGFTKIAGQGKSDGTFVIPKVPAGYYWLQLTTPADMTRPYSSPGMFWTNSNDFDRGTDALGRPPSSTAVYSLPVTANLNVSGLSPWVPGSTFVGLVPNSGADLYLGSTSAINTGATSFLGSINGYRTGEIDASKGDATYLIQSEDLQAVGFYYFVPRPSRSASVLGPLPLTISDSTRTVNLSGQFSTTPTASLRAKAVAAGFSQSLADSSPLAYPLGFGGFVTHMPAGDRTIVPPITVAMQNMSLAAFGGVEKPTSDIDQGTISYVNPFPSSWTPVYTAVQYGAIDFYLSHSGGEVGMLSQNGYTSTTPPTDAQPFALPMTPVQSPMVNGTNMFATTSMTEPLTLSWTAPKGSAATGYLIYVEEMDPPPPPCVPAPGEPCDSSPVNLTTIVTTTSTSITLPTGILIPGRQYVFIIEAHSDPKSNMLTAPFRYSLNHAFSYVMSDSIWARSATVASEVQTQQKPSAGAQNVPVFTVTPRGVQQVGVLPAGQTLSH